MTTTTRQRLSQQALVNFELYIFKAKWLLIIVGMLFISYLALGSVHGLEQSSNQRANIWDALFTVFGNIYFDLIAILLPFVYIVGDLTVDTSFQAQMVLKMPGRQEWWLGKVVTLALTAFLYTSLVIVGVVLLVSASYSWSSNWSAVAQSLPFGSYVTASMLEGSPILYFTVLIFLLMMSLFTLGLLAQIGVLVWKSPVSGFMLAATVIMLGALAHGFQIQPPLRYIFIPSHILPFYDTGANLERFMLSCAYWFVGAGILIAIGLIQSKRVDFVS